MPGCELFDRVVATPEKKTAAAGNIRAYTHPDRQQCNSIAGVKILKSEGPHIRSTAAVRALAGRLLAWLLARSRPAAVRGAGIPTLVLSRPGMVLYDCRAYDYTLQDLL